MRLCVSIVVLLTLLTASTSSNADPDRAAARARLYAQLAEHNLLQIMLVVPKTAGAANLSKRSDSGWTLHGDVLCVDVGALREEIETRDVREFPDEVRRQPIDAGAFYRAVRFSPPQLITPSDDRDYVADLSAALRRFAHAKLVKKVAIDINQGGAGCAADAFAVPAIRFYSRANPLTRNASWLERLQRGDAVVLGLLTVAELRAATNERIAAGPTSMPRSVRVDRPDATNARAEETIYGALRIEPGRCKPCYVASDDPLPQLVAWTMADSAAVKRWMNGTSETPKPIADLDGILAEFRKPATQRNCTLLVATTPVLERVKSGLERDKFTPTLYPETASSKQVLAAFGFRTLEELRFARDFGVTSGEQFAQLRVLGLDTRAAFESAVRRYSWLFGNPKPDAETLAHFVRDEREAAARGMSVKALRAERSKREQAGTRATAHRPG